jgi:hypothetical protein
MRHHHHDDIEQPFGHLPNELRVFPTPWHRYVHGLGLGQVPVSFDPSKAQRLLETSRVVGQKTGRPYHAFAHELLQGILSACEAMALDGDAAGQQGQAELANAVAQLATLSDPWQYGRACAMLIESLVKLGRLEAHTHPLRQNAQVALQQVEALRPATDKDRYERLQLFGNLMLAVGQAGWTDLLTSPQPHGGTYIVSALQGIDTIAEVFYRGRGAAMVFTALGIVGCASSIWDGPQDYLHGILDVFDAELSQTSLTERAAYHDPVHSFADTFIFPLSLNLNAMAILNRPAYLTYKRDWVTEAVALFQLLPPPSRASQVMFYVGALSNLGVLDAHVPDMATFLRDCMDGYLQATDGTQVDDYLRCAYLVHLAWQIGQLELLTPRVWSILMTSLPRIAGSDLYCQSPYGSSYMVAAYTLSALDIGNRFETLFDDAINLLAAIDRFQEDADATTMTLPRLDFALIDAALRLRPARTGDTDLFGSLRLGHHD